MICRLFIDEVGNGDLRGSANDDNVRYLSLTGILTTIGFHDTRIVPSLAALKTEVFGRPDVILHRRDILRRDGIFTVFSDAEKARIFDEGIRLFAKPMPYLVKTVTIDKRSHLNTYDVWRFDPYHYCLTCLVERYVAYLTRHGATGDVAIEPRFKLADKRVKQSFNLLYDQGSPNIPAKLMQKRLISRDIKFFDKKANVAAMQLCDLVAHPSYQAMKFKREGLEAPPDFGTALVEILMDKKYARHPKTLSPLTPDS